MSKRLIPLVAAMMLGISLAAPAVVSGEVFKRSCLDIESGGGQTTADGTDNYDLVFALQTPKPCPGAIFTLYVYDDQGHCASLPTGEVGAPAATLTVRGSTLGLDGVHGEVAYSANNVDDDGTVWVVATSALGSTTYDRAPDAGCTDYSTDPPGKPFG